MSVAWPAGVRLLVFFCSSVPVVLFGTPGITRCRSQHVSVESSSLLHHSIYLWFVCFTWWSLVGWKAFTRTERPCVLGHGGGWGQGWVPVKPVWAPGIFILTVPRRYFCCGSLLFLVFSVRVCTLVRLLCWWHVLWVLGSWPPVLEGAVRSVCRGCLSWAAVGLCVWLFPFWFWGRDVGSDCISF